MPRDHPQREASPPGARALAVAIFCWAAAAPAAAQEVEPSWSQRALGAINESTAVGLIPAEQRQPGWNGWWADAWEGSKRIFNEGQSDLLLPFYSWHPAYAYPNRFDQNHYSWGAGLARTLIDENDNERMIYALGFSDSHYDFQATVGYAWVARWPLADGLKWGLGYTAFVAVRSDANYIPFPAVLPLASIGTDRVMVYGSWVPFSDVLFLFARISLHDDARGPAPGAGAPAAFGLPVVDGGRARLNLIYGAAGFVNTDASGINGIASGNSWAPVAGYRRLFTESLAMDVSVSRSNLTLELNGQRLGEFDLIPVTLTAQYYFPSFRGLRTYAGVGAAYNIVTEQDLPGYDLSRTSLSPLLQAGFTYPITHGLMLTGGVSANFTRNQLSQAGTNLGTVQLSPVTFSLGVGYAF